MPLISLANIFQNARLWEDALTVARMAVEIAPHFVVNHFTLANVYITMVAASLPFFFCPLRFVPPPAYIQGGESCRVPASSDAVVPPPVFRTPRRSLRKRCAGTSPL